MGAGAERRKALEEIKDVTNVFGGGSKYSRNFQFQAASRSG
jgi:hypothetical protein